MGGKNKMSCNELFNNKLSKIGYRLSKSYLKKKTILYNVYIQNNKFAGC